MSYLVSSSKLKYQVVSIKYQDNLRFEFNLQRILILDTNYLIPNTNYLSQNINNFTFRKTPL